MGESAYTINIIQNKTSQNMRDLQEFLDLRTAKDVKGPSNNISDQLGHVYELKDDQVEDFFTRIEKCRREGLKMHFSEMQKNATHSGCMFDFDIYQNKPDRQVNNEHFNQIFRFYFELLFSLVEIPKELGNRITTYGFIIQKPNPVHIKDRNGWMGWKDGFHALAPGIQIRYDLKEYIHKEINNRYINRIFEDIEYNKNEKILDMASRYVPVLFYGNKKKEATTSYPLVEMIKITYSLESKDLRYTIVDTKTKDDFIQNHNLSYELSLRFSLDSIDNHPTFQQKIKLEALPEVALRVRNLSEKFSGNVTEDEIEFCEDSVNTLRLADAEANYLFELLKLLPVEYAESFEKWTKVVWALANTSLRYKPLAAWFSHRGAKKWDLATFERVWEQGEHGSKNGENLSTRSIIHWARQADEAGFKRATSVNYQKVLYNMALKNEGVIEHAEVAKVLRIMLGEKFIYDCEGKFAHWFEFVLPEEDHIRGEVLKWRDEGAEPSCLHKYMSEQLKLVYHNVGEELKKQKNEATTEILSKFYSNTCKNFSNYTKKLSNDGFQNGVLRQCKHYFRRRGFAKTLDRGEEEKWILGVGNGVLHMSYTHPFKAIPSEPKLITSFHEFKISKYTDVPYVPYDPSNPIIQRIIKIYQDIFIEPDVFEHIWLTFSTALIGRRKPPKIHFIQGVGRNGKTYSMEQVLNVLGLKYAVKSTMALLTGSESKASEANSAHIFHKDKRMILYDESNKAEKLNTKKLKDFTAAVQNGRDLFGAQENFDVNAIQFALTNFEPIIDTTDDGTWRRIAYYNVKVKFCDHPDPKNPFEKKVDKTLGDSKVDDMEWKKAILGYLVYWFQILRNKYGGDVDNHPCPTFVKETDEYRSRNDKINRFINDMIVESPGHSEFYTLKKLANEYVDWYKDTRDGRGCPNTIDEIMQMIENSKISNRFNVESRNGTSIKVLRDHRVLNSVDDVVDEIKEKRLNQITRKVAPLPEIVIEEEEIEEEDIIEDEIEECDEEIDECDEEIEEESNIDDEEGDE